MKRSGPPARRTPLQAGGPLQRKPLKRANGAGPHQGPWPSRSKPIKAKRDGARRRSRDDPDHGMAWADVRLVIYARALGRCELCGAQLNIAQMEGHHRLPRRYGPDCPCNALALCGPCHQGPEVHGGPEDARARGRIISQHDDRDPTSVPVETTDGLVELTCGGTVIAVEN